VLRAPTIAAAQRAGWWSRAAGAAGVELDARDLERLAATVTIAPQHIKPSMTLAARHMATGASGSTVELVQRAARDLVPTPLPPGVRRIEPTYGWDDIVLTDQSKQLLRTISVHVLHAGRVLEEWGFATRVPYGQGVAALFCGLSGTGKTMAAQIIARDLGVELVQVDLSKTVSKYIGETEKNLDAAFDAAERVGAVLLFDEADAVFGKRTEISDAHDRYANVEVAYLLQRMESFRGLAVLTTNMKQNIDDAFVRRLRFVVEFALPDAAERLRIWRKAFPPEAPVAPGVDVAVLARRLPIAGGSIQNIALHAAFLAASSGGPIGALHVLDATRRELLKIGMFTAARSLDDLAA
jgi:SpoVK/Ycf46/Vps4 family AAA+-type ATPase